MLFVLPPLPYTYNALEPYIEARTMEIHYTKHHQAYVDQLNAALKKHPEMPERSLAELVRNLASVPEDIRLLVRNNAGGVHNHTFFWDCMRPYKASDMHEPTGALLGAIQRDFKSFSDFKKQFSTAAKERFGSGWVWLVLQDNRLSIISTANQDSPLSDGLEPILGLDVWEHAYYLQYQNRRIDYVDSWWNIVNWDFVAGCYERLMASRS